MWVGSQSFAGSVGGYGDSDRERDGDDATRDGGSSIYSGTGTGTGAGPGSGSVGGKAKSTRAPGVMSTKSEPPMISIGP